MDKLPYLKPEEVLVIKEVLKKACQVIEQELGYDFREKLNLKFSVLIHSCDHADIIAGGSICKHHMGIALNHFSTELLKQAGVLSKSKMESIASKMNPPKGPVN